MENLDSFCKTHDDCLVNDYLGTCILIFSLLPKIIHGQLLGSM